MRNSRFTTEQILGFLKEREAGAKISHMAAGSGSATTRFTAKPGNMAGHRPCLNCARSACKRHHID
jgi:hypothetical protein